MFAIQNSFVFEKIIKGELKWDKQVLRKRPDGAVTNGFVQQFLHCCYIAVSVLYTANLFSARRLPITLDFLKVQLNGHSVLQFSSWVCLQHSLEM